jgi:hypothetical protein
MNTWNSVGNAIGIWRCRQRFEDSRLAVAIVIAATGGEGVAAMLAVSLRTSGIVRHGLASSRSCQAGTSESPFKQSNGNPASKPARRIF